MVSAQKLTTNTQNYNHGAPYHNDTATDLDILNRAKKITLISYNDMATASQVAEYYEVESGALRACICRHRKELENDGLILMSSSEFIALHNPTLKERSRGRMVIKDDNGNEFTLSAGKTTFLPVKAILHIGMLLQESPVAIEVCKQLLCATTPSGKSQNQLQPTDRKHS